jgi:hypothetical protein
MNNRLGMLQVTRSNPSRPEPAYLRLLQSGELARRVEQAYRHLENCDLCASEQARPLGAQFPPVPAEIDIAELERADLPRQRCIKIKVSAPKVDPRNNA